MIGGGVSRAGDLLLGRPSARRGVTPCREAAPRRDPARPPRVQAGVLGAALIAAHEHAAERDSVPGPP